MIINIINCLNILNVMNQKVLQNVWLRVAMIVAVVTTAFAGTVWAEGNTSITVELEGFSAYNGQTGQIVGQIDGNISFTTTDGSISGSNLTAKYFTLTAANNAKINSVTFHYTGASIKVDWKIPNTTTHGEFDAYGWGSETQQNPTVSDLNVGEIVFSNQVITSGNYFSIDYISVTYTPGTPDNRITALSNDNAKGTVELNGNVIVAHPNAGYSIDEENPFTVTDGEADVIPYGSKYIAVVPSSNCTIVINFVAHEGSLSLDFEHSSNADWNCQGFERVKSTNPNPHGGTYMGQTTANTASIQTTAPVYPETFSCWICPQPGTNSSGSWKVQVSSDTGWDDVYELNYVVGWQAGQYSPNTWYPINVDLSGYTTDVYVRLYYSGTQAAVDDIVLTTRPAPEVSTIPVTITAAGYATFVPEANVSIPASLKAFKVTGATSTSVTMEEVTAVPAGSAVVLKGTAGTYDLTVVESADALSGNLLQVSNGSVNGDGNTIFVLANLSNGVGFYRMASGQTIPAGKAYLVIGSSTKEFYGFEEDGATGIEKTLSDSPLKGENIYNLAGQRINKLQRGINIVNGKKILF